MKTTTIRIALVGFGLGGRVFHAPLISSVEGLELAAVLERNSSHAAQRYPGLRTCRTLDELLSDSTIDLVVVTTPSGTHFEIARQVLEAGKHAVVDKPTATSAAEVADLSRLASARDLHLIPFHNRRWDNDFRTVHKLIHEGSLGHLVHVHSCFDRWSPGASRKPWKDDPDQGGGTLLDLGTHLVDQALVLFGKPKSVSAEVRRERGGEGSNDSFTLRLFYETLLVTLEANALSSLARPRFHLRGTHGNFWKPGVDPQEAALAKITRITDPHWGEEPQSAWGTLSVDVDGGIVTRPVPSITGDYRFFYAGVRDTLLGKQPPPVKAIDAWRVAQLLEWATESSGLHCDIECDWSQESS
ncbi:MAG TPA: Gfo/Idh/MocA family oxidoreductase [Terracidiphilus sp.]|nr:Gfo/Idh/MocA family oxidoreductase [Terracidiphilus sp.]